jgi:hypothetical protein
VLFIHGLTGAADEATWALFPDLLREDPEVSQRYDIGLFEYATNWKKHYPSTRVPEAAKMLRTKLDTDWKKYTEIAVIAHSQGGLVTRRYVADQLKASLQHRIGRVLFFATPNLGALGGKIAELGSGSVTSDEAADLAYDSEMIKQLLLDEAQTKAHLSVPTRFVVAREDRLVGATSAWGRGLPGDYIEVAGEGHLSIVKVTSPKHPSFEIAHNFLLDGNVSTAADAAPIHDQPLLKTHQFNQTQRDRERNRFVYWNMETPFVGREAESKAINVFLADSNRRFSFMLLTGPGGMGKSRLTLEIILAQRTGWWHAGFLGDLKTPEYWKLWQPQRPTLIVVDYAARQAEQVGEMLSGLAEREAPHLLRQPVRMILIERHGKDPRLENIFETSRLLRGDTFRMQDVALPPINDIWPLFEHVLRRPGSVIAPERVDKATTLDAFDKIDSDRRPLFAFLVADALARGRDIRGWDRDALLDDVIKRDRHKFWLSAAKSVGMGDQIDKEERVLALATLANGLFTKSSLAKVDGEVLPHWDADRHPVIFRAMSGESTDDFIAPLQPDLVGEFFVLQLLERKGAARTSDGRTFLEVLVSRSWEIDPASTPQFIIQCMQDLPELPGVRQLFDVIPDDPIGRRNWPKLAFRMISTLAATRITDALEIYDKAKSVAAAYPSEIDFRIGQAYASIPLMEYFFEDVSTCGRAFEIFDELMALVAVAPTKEEITYKFETAVRLLLRAGNGATRKRALERYELLRYCLPKMPVSPSAVDYHISMVVKLYIKTHFLPSDVESSP